MAKSIDERVREMLGALMMENMALAAQVEQLKEEKAALENIVTRIQTQKSPE